MYGKKVRLRAFFILLIFISLSLTVFIVFKSFEKNVVYFMSPSDIKNSPELETKKIRVGGMVKEKSIKITDTEINFIITDFKNELIVSFNGSVPNLFEEGKGAVIEGILQDRNYIKADKILAKHDENYMPPEVRDALEKSN
tara:strand:- start:1194 stop:1616 length:423 start_codon:yes stop_codon:yes gene_type:complete